MAKIIVEPRMRGFISLTAHPDGCATRVVKEIEIAKEFALSDKPKNVLVIGSSQGYGLSSLLTSCFGYGDKTLGICFEKPPSANKTATAGWYNLVEAHKQADAESRELYTINGDAFSQQVKNTAAEKINQLKVLEFMVLILGGYSNLQNMCSSTFFMCWSIIFTC